MLSYIMLSNTCFILIMSVMVPMVILLSVVIAIFKMSRTIFLVMPLTDDSRHVIYIINMFIVQAAIWSPII
jgi:hypothetical protein